MTYVTSFASSATHALHFEFKYYGYVYLFPIVNKNIAFKVYNDVDRSV